MNRLQQPVNLSSVLSNGTSFELYDELQERATDEDNDNLAQTHGCIPHESDILFRLREVGETEFIRDMVDLFDNGRVLKKQLEAGRGMAFPMDSPMAKVGLKYSVILCDDDTFESVDSTIGCAGQVRVCSVGLLGPGGFKMALSTMRVGEMSVFYVHYSELFGELGCPPRFPPRTSAVYVVTFVKIETSGTLYQDLKDCESSDIPFSKAFQALQTAYTDAGNLYEEGKQLWNKRPESNAAYWKIKKALRLYVELADVAKHYWTTCKRSETLNVDAANKLYGRVFRCYSNACLIALKLEEFSEAISYADEALKINSALSQDETNIVRAKVYRNKAIALMERGELDKAENCLIKSKSLDPSSQYIARAFSDLRQRRNKNLRIDRDLSRRMFNAKLH